MPDTVLKWPAELGPALRVGFSFKLHSQFIVKKKKKRSWPLDLWPLAWCPGGIHSVLPLSQRFPRDMSSPTAAGHSGCTSLCIHGCPALLPPLVQEYLSKLGPQWLGEGRRPSLSRIYESFPLKSATA